MCHKPICRECRIWTPQGIVCSEECEKKLSKFQERMEKLEGKPILSKKRIPGFIKFILFAVIVLVILYFIFGIENLGELKELIKSLF